MWMCHYTEGGNTECHVAVLLFRRLKNLVSRIAAFQYRKWIIRGGYNCPMMIINFDKNGHRSSMWKLFFMKIEVLSSV